MRIQKVLCTVFYNTCVKYVVVDAVTSPTNYDIFLVTQLGLVTTLPCIPLFFKTALLRHNS